MTICNKPVSHVTDQGRKICAEHASIIKADPADGAPLVHGLPAEAKNGEFCSYITPDVVEEPEPGTEGIEPETTGVGSVPSEA